MLLTTPQYRQRSSGHSVEMMMMMMMVVVVMKAQCSDGLQILDFLKSSGPFDDVIRGNHKKSYM